MRRLSFLVILITLPFLGYCQNKQKQRFATIHNKEVKNTELAELAEVLGLCKLESSKTNNDYECRVFNVCNGPSDPELEYCNCSTNYYLSNTKTDLPTEYKIFKVGPFYEVEGVNLDSGEKDGTFILTIKHGKNEKKLENKFLVSFSSITQLKE